MSNPRTPPTQHTRHRSHHSSPSIIAASILRQTREIEPALDAEVDEVAAKDEATAEALRKLDGLSSPRMSRVFSAGTSAALGAAGVDQSPTKRAAGTPPSSHSRRSSASGSELKRRTRSSTGGSTQIAKETDTARHSISSAQLIASPHSIHSPAISSQPNSPSLGSLPRSPILHSLQFPTSAPPPRAIHSANRRSSASSDVSSIHSTADGPFAPTAPLEPDTVVIPPVPPIPQAYETFRSSTSATSTSSAQNSPRFDQNAFDRRPSEASSFADGAMLSPRSADMDFSWSQTQPRKWSFSNAFSKSPKSPKMPESASFSDLQSPSSRERLSSFGSSASTSAWKRMAASSNDIAGLAISTSSNSIASHAGGSLGRSSGRISSNAMSRSRTESTATKPTTLGLSRDNNPSPPQLVTTSPGRSRSSLLTPRRPSSSGIPFFSRKASSSSITATPSPNLSRRGSTSPSTPATQPEEKEKVSSGRKSILGINFLSRKDKKEKEKAPPSPALSSHTFSSNSSMKSPVLGHDEFGRRASAPAKTTSLITRKRGKTLGSKDEPTQVAAVNLPPMHVNALSATTVKRVNSLSSSTASAASKNSTPSSHRIAPPSTRANKLQESLKANLPTIAGSPSTAGRAQPSAEEFALRSSSPSDFRGQSNTSPPKSQTPTKIPRLYTQRIVPATASPRMRSAASSRGPSPTNTVKPNPLFVSTTSTATAEPDMLFAPAGGELGEKPATARLRQESTSSMSGIPRSKSSATMTGLPRAQRRTSLAPDEPRSVTGRAPGAAARTSSLMTPKSNASGSDSSSATSTGTARRASTKPSDILSQSTSAVPSGSRRASAAPTTSASSEVRSSRGLTSKLSLPVRMTRSSTTGSLNAPPSESGRSSSSSQRPVASEEEIRGDEEMAQYVRRQQAKKMAAGVSSEVVRKMFDFPDPTEPLPALSAKEASSLYGRYLSPYERDEINSHARVYFVGPNCDKKQANRDQPMNNFGYDDERGDYVLVPHDQILYRYEAIDVLGKGSFGQVLQCRDHKTGEMVAIKMIRNKKRFHNQALVEIKVLENLVKWDPDEKHHVIRMVDSFSFRGHLCIVTELLSINLYELVKANSFSGFSTVLLRRFTSQILGSLSLLRHQRVVHCDLKPENILLKHPAKSAIKVIDFGSSCFENEKVYTYIQSRFYRSPEVILGLNYHMAIDMWSLGCIIAEMYTGYPIFPGENEQEQLACIMEVLGVPDKYLVDRSSRKRLFFDSTGAPRPVVNSKGKRRRPSTKTLAQVLKTDDEVFLDFIAKCLIWDPDRRLKPDPALRHPFVLQARARTASPHELGASTRSTRSSLAASVNSSSTYTSTAPAASSGTSPKIGTISTPRKVVPTSLHSSTTSSVSQSATMPRTRTMSTFAGGSSNGSGVGGPARLTSKGSSQLPATKHYSVHS